MNNSSLPLETNVQTFNRDTAAHGGYVYSMVERWSSQYSTGRQTDFLIELLNRHFSGTVRIVDIGCGDGTYTMDLAERFAPASVRGIDPAHNAISAASARVPDHLKTSVSFEAGNIYDVQQKGETVAVARGVLHHLDRPQEAIAQLCSQFSHVIALEPNGYNPAMKLIEKVSPYHRAHDEKSYWPPALNRWFAKQGFSLVEQRFFCLVPYFCPTPLAKMLHGAENAIESLPVAREIFCSTNLVLYRKNS
jgi:SAM-dependent methyltransferase